MPEIGAINVGYEVIYIKGPTRGVVTNVHNEIRIRLENGMIDITSRKGLDTDYMPYILWKFDKDLKELLDAKE